MKHFLFATVALALFATGFAQNEYQLTSKGMYYKIIPTGGGMPVSETGVARFHIEQKINDSVIFSSFGKGLSVISIKRANNVDEHAGIIKKMRAGDSLVTLNLANDLMKNKELVLPDFIHAGDSLFQCIKIVDVFNTEKEFETFKKAETDRKLATDQKIIENYLAAKNIKATKTKKGAFIEMKKKGVGAFPVKGSKVAVKYTGQTLEGVVFDGNENPAEGKPLLEFETGMGNMIAGFDEGVSLLQKGGRCRVYMPSVLAYGESGSGELIGANAILIFDIELVKLSLPAKPIVKKPVPKKIKK
jgi:FKBP-type peptidyl-prolyl cis-trans isomerase FkpA